jgi:transcriptional repressor NrdR
VAYVRFASVYRDFREAADFHEVLGEIAERATAAEQARTQPVPQTGTPVTPKPRAETAERKH